MKIYIRRLRYDEARAKLEQELEQAFLQGDRYVEIIHGIGGGILQKMAREYVEACNFLKIIPDSENPGVLRVEVLSPGKDTIRSFLRRS